MNTKHTPGPWSVSEINAAGNVDQFHIFIEPNVAVIERKVAGQDECDMPDARLIASAPELLVALIEQDKWLGALIATVPLSEKDTHRRLSIAREQARTAIAKAKGE